MREPTGQLVTVVEAMDPLGRHSRMSKGTEQARRAQLRTRLATWQTKATNNSGSSTRLIWKCRRLTLRMEAQENQGLQWLESKVAASMLHVGGASESVVASIEVPSLAPTDAPFSTCGSINYYSSLARRCGMHGRMAACLARAPSRLVPTHACMDRDGPAVHACIHRPGAC